MYCQLITVIGCRLSAIGYRQKKGVVMQDFRNLEVWQEAHGLTIEVDRVTTRFPDDERFGLTSQVRRSCASIGANLAEGCGRATDADFARFVQMAMGSASETEYHLLLALDLRFIDEPTYRDLDERIRRIKKMLTSLLKRLRQQPTATI